MILQKFLLLIFTIKLICAHEAKDLDDSILYKIEFKPPLNPESDDFNSKYQLSKFYTHHLEEYTCAIPIAEESREEKDLDYTGLSPLQLIQPMFSSVSCSYRIEAYWSYEICHGFHIKQYHEEREDTFPGKSVKFQEYYLGRWSDEKQDKLTQKLAEDRKNGIQFKTTKIDNVNYPYLELEMSNGTLCDLNNEPRTTKIRYVCYPHGKNAIYSFKETSSCNYEAIILTATLCLHPAFLPEESKEIPIKCFNSYTEATKPLSLLRQNMEDLHFTKTDIFENMKFSADGLNVFDLQKIFEKMASKQYFEDIINAQTPSSPSPSSTPEESKVVTNAKNGFPRDDYEALYDFLFGNCLVGGSGWWKYEFCFGRHVRQFHTEKKTETEVMLGYFKADLHREWLKSHPAKRLRRNPTGTDTNLWNHYGAGSQCDKTGKLRETDVKLVCIPPPQTSTSNSPGASDSSTSSESTVPSSTSVSMYLLEPRTCQYILVIESPMVCSLIEMVDDDGLITKPRFTKHVYELIAKNKGNIETYRKLFEDNGEAITVYRDDVPGPDGTSIFGV